VLTLRAATAAEAVETLKGPPVHILFVDHLAPGVEATDFVGHALRLRPSPLVIALALADAPSRTDLIRAGVFDLLSKPLSVPSLRLLVHRALRQLDLLDELSRLREELQSREGYDRIVGRSAVMTRLREQVERLAATDLSVWFAGEEGTGKELAARTLHALSSRTEQPFIVVNCAGLSELAWEGEWLRAEPGESEGASGILEQAAGGTIYLEELTELPLELQERLLAVLERGAIGGARAGEPAPEIRLLAGSRRDPIRAMEQHRLLEGLYHRLAQAQLDLPRLSERTEDIPLLARHFVSRIGEINHLDPLQISPEALALIEQYAWPGNVQELRNAVEHAVILAVDGTIRPTDLPDRTRTGAAGAAAPERRDVSGLKFRDAKREVVEQFERSYLSQLLEQHWGNVTSASQQAGMLRSALQRLLRKYGLKSADFRKARRTPRPPGPRKPPVD
jgi:DNA-binding NtrC family response regulator